MPPRGAGEVGERASTGEVLELSGHSSAGKMSSDLHRRAAQLQEGGEESLSSGVSIPGPPPPVRTGRPPQRARPASDPLTRAVQGVFSLVAAAEFEILFVAFFLIVFLWLKDFVSGRCDAPLLPLLLPQQLTAHASPRK